MIDQNNLYKEKLSLSNAYTFWFYSMSNNEENFNENLKNVITFDTVEDFWSIYSHIVRPDKMPENG